MKRTQYFDRYFAGSKDSLIEAEHGNLFISRGFRWDSDQIAVVHSGVDTVKQLYNCLLDKAMYSTIETLFNIGHGEFIELKSIDGEILPFMVTSGRKGGYRYALLNRDYGAVILVGSNYIKEDLNGSHIKVELSPHLIMNSTDDEIQKLMDSFSKQLADQVLHAGVALHLCADVQGFEVPEDLDRVLTTRSKRVVARTGLSEFNFSTVAGRYGKGQSFLFGTASSLQFAVYRKDIEAEENDKMHLWGSKWGEAMDRLLEPSYVPGEPVWRLELRFHHTVIEELGNDQGVTIKSYADAVPYLTSFWRYGLDKSYRLDLDPIHIHPVWQYLIQSSFISTNKDIVFARRVKKEASYSSRVNIKLFLGNFLSLCARARYPVQYVMKGLQNCGLWRDLLSYWKFKTGIFDNESDLIFVIQRDVNKALMVKTVAYGAAV